MNTARYFALLVTAALLLSMMPALYENRSLDGSESGDVGSLQTRGPTSTPADDYGVGSESLITNVLDNGDLERWDSGVSPTSWLVSGSAFSRVNMSYQDDYYSGLRSCQLVVQYTDQFSSSIYVGQYPPDTPRPYLSQSVRVSTWWKGLEAPDPMPASAFYQVVRIVANEGYYNLYYLLMVGGGTFSNTSSSAYFLLNGSMGVWNNLDRNVTADFESVFRPIQGNDYVYRARWYVENSIAAESPTEVLIDGCSIVNGTGREYLTDGGFESGGTNWARSSNYDPGSLAPSNEGQTGSYSANLTACAAALAASNVQFYDTFGYPQGFYPFAVGTGKLEFWYKYEDTWDGGTGQYALASCYLQNQTHSYFIYIYLGVYRNGDIPTNSSNYMYLRASGYGDRGVWHHVSLELGPLFASMGAINGVITQLGFYCYAGSDASSRTVALVDDVRYYDYPTGDPGFEEDWTDFLSQPYYVLPAYSTTMYPVVNRTDDAFSGDHAARVRVAPGSTYGTITRYVNIPYLQDLFFSLRWRLDSVGTLPSPYYSIVYLFFEHGSRSIGYILTYGAIGLGNSSANVLYRATDFNQTGGWNHLLRNITEDYYSAFGSVNWNLTQVYFESYCESSDPLVVLFDDVGFVDGVPPEVDSTQRVTTTPVYYEPVVVQTHAVDAFPGIGQVLVYYSTGGAPASVAATHIGGGIYQASIPAQPWDSDVEWYVYAEDACGTWRTDDNSSAMYRYMVGDDVDPIVSVSAPAPASTVSGDVDVSLTASDVGSGIERVQLSIDSVLVSTDYSPPYAFAWDSRSVANGSRMVTCTAFDSAGNSHSDSVTVDVQNDFAGPLLSGVELNPSAPEYDDDVVVLVAGTDLSGVKNVTLSYRYGAGNWQRVLMTKSASLYTGMIPSADWNTQVSYYVQAFDTLGQFTGVGSMNDPLGYTVGDSVVPTIGVAGPPLTGNLSGIVDFSVTATDAGSQIATVTMYVDGTIDSTTAGGIFTARWDTTKFADGEHVVLFVAEDGAGNTAMVSFTYRVRNPVGIEAISNAFAQIMSRYGFFVGAGVVALVIGAGKVFMGRRAASGAASTPRGKKT